MGRADLVFLVRGLHLAILTVVLIATVHGGITVVALDQAVVAVAIAAISGLWTIRYAFLRPAALGRSVGLPMMAALGMVPVVLVLGRLLGLTTTPSWTSLLILGPLALVVFAVIVWVVMPGPLRKGWAALRGRSDAGTTADLQADPSGNTLSCRERLRSNRHPRALPGGWPASRRSVLAMGAVMVALALSPPSSSAAGRYSLWPPFPPSLCSGSFSAAWTCVAVLAADFYFNAYLAQLAGIITVDKGIGAIAVAAWVLDWTVNRRPVLSTRQLWLIVAFLLWTAVSISFAVSEKAALVTSLRYVTFATLYFLVIQTVRGDRRQADALIKVVVLPPPWWPASSAWSPSSAITSSGQAGRSRIPTTSGSSSAAACRWRSTRCDGAPRWSKALWGVALVLILGCTLATFSRSALTGLAVAGLWALVTRRLRLRWLLADDRACCRRRGVAFLLAPQLVRSAFHQKAHVARANVDVRLGYYRVELNEWEHYPITGVGPGNFVYRFFQFAPAAGESLPYPSHVLTISGEEAYLVILAEQGAVGLALFLGYLALSWADLRRRFPDDQRSDQLQAALAAGFIVACVGALFLTEQYYPPLWFLPAIGGQPGQLQAARRA